MLEMIMDRGNFLEACGHWRSRQTELGNLSGVYLNTVSGRQFVLNIDWFNPFDKTPYSAGAMYLIVLNLPRY